MELDILTLIAGLVVGATVYFIVRRLTAPSSAQPRFTAEIKNEPSRELGGDDDKTKLSIFYGSQTGTAEDFASMLSDEGDAYGFATEVVDLDDVDPTDLEEVKYAIFCMATYGEGDPTDNSRKFYEFISGDEDPSLLSGMKYCVFGLGNLTYEHYNVMGKETDKKLEALGAERVYPLGLGDDNHSLEEDFDKWKRDLWNPMCLAADLPVLEHTNIKKQRRYEMAEVVPKKGAKVMSHHFQTTIDIEQSGDYLTPSEGLFKQYHRIHKMYDAKSPYLGRVMQNRELFAPGADRSCLHLEVELIKNASLRYQPGDHIGVFPENDRGVVEYVAKRLNFDLDQVIKLSPAGKSKALPMGPFTVRRALTSYMDLTAKPRQSFLREIAQFAEDDEERARLLKLGDTSNDETVHEFQQYIVKDYRNIVDILEEFESLNPPLDWFFELTPRLDPRFYSISSAQDEDRTVVSITAVVVDVPKKGGKNFAAHKGVCTGWFSGLKGREENVFMPCFIRKSDFKLPRNASTPIIMIGPGTGIAPFRGFLQWRKNNQQKELGPACLFFGCRSAKVDFLYEDEINTALEGKYLSEFFGAFSRDQAHKIYVQNLLVEQSKHIYETYLKPGGVVYVCGDATQMAKDVFLCIKGIYKECEGLDDEAAEAKVMAMKTEHRYQEDVWHS